LEDLSGLGSKVVDTSDSDHKDGLRFRGNIEGSFSSSLSSESNELLFFGSLLLVVGFTSLGVFSSLGLGLFLSLSDESLSGISELGVSVSLLEVDFRGSGLGSGGGLTLSRGSGGLSLGLLVLFDLH